MISFVIPAHNESALIGATLDALHIAAKAACVGYEIVVKSHEAFVAQVSSTRDRATALVHRTGVEAQ